MWQSYRRVSFCLALLVAACSPPAAGRALAAEQTLASNRPAGEISRVEILLEVGGDLSLRDEKEKKTHRLKTSVVGTMVYDEKLLTPSATSPDARGAPVSTLRCGDQDR